jgi:carbon monoxide dehydrogenase subunit G
MKLEIGGEETFALPVERLWAALNDPAVLERCIPGCKGMTANGEDRFRVLINLKVASVGGTMEGDISLSDKIAPTRCRINVAGSGTLGHAQGHATFSLAPGAAGEIVMRYAGEGEIGGLVAGVGQRILKGVAKHLLGQFFSAFRRALDPSAA